MLSLFFCKWIFPPKQFHYQELVVVLPCPNSDFNHLSGNAHWWAILYLFYSVWRQTISLVKGRVLIPDRLRCFLAKPFYIARYWIDKCSSSEYARRSTLFWTRIFKHSHVSKCKPIWDCRTVEYSAWFTLLLFIFLESIVNST
jgi:hypothetical protein